jgi:hypothetical protein
MVKVSANDRGKPSPLGAMALARTWRPIAPAAELLGDVRNSLSHLEFLNEPEIQGLIEEW